MYSKYTTFSCFFLLSSLGFLLLLCGHSRASPFIPPEPIYSDDTSYSGDYNPVQSSGSREEEYPSASPPAQRDRAYDQFSDEPEIRRTPLRPVRRERPEEHSKELRGDQRETGVKDKQLSSPFLSQGQPSSGTTGDAGQLPQEKIHIVVKEDTLFSIAADYSVTVEHLARHNYLLLDERLVVGMILVIPDTDRSSSLTSPSQTASLPTMREVEKNNQESSKIAPNSPSQIKVADSRISQEKTKSSKKKAPENPKSDSGKGNFPSGKFRWPARGRILSEFGSFPGGVQNDGINIALPEGTAIKASQDGVVVYAGNGLKGYGQLILIRHEGDWVTAYAHSSEILVRQGARVRRGDVIAKAGKTGNVDQPQLHFEIRKGTSPVNPIPLFSNGQ